MARWNLVPFTRKPGNFDEAGIVLVDDLAAALEGERLPVFSASDLWDADEHPLTDFKRETPQHFLLCMGSARYVVDTQGYTYCRYMARVVSDADVRHLSG
jgi:hypothetical protein